HFENRADRGEEDGAPGVSLESATARDLSVLTVYARVAFTVSFSSTGTPFVAQPSLSAEANIERPHRANSLAKSLPDGRGHSSSNSTSSTSSTGASSSSNLHDRIGKII
ncbi:unnamed protein product, partial [Pylaiella littoralis]